MNYSLLKSRYFIIALLTSMFFSPFSIAQGCNPFYSDGCGSYDPSYHPCTISDMKNTKYKGDLKKNGNPQGFAKVCVYFDGVNRLKVFKGPYFWSGCGVLNPSLVSRPGLHRVAVSDVICTNR